MTTITVMGATGRTGGAIAQNLLAHGVHVRALARTAEKLHPLAQRGAEALPGIATDVAYLTNAFRGADAAYVLMPHDPGEPGYLALQRRQGEAIAEALRASGIRRVVCLSSIGADVPTDTGVLQSLYEQEQRLRTVEGRDILFLRPGAFFEVYHAALPLIRSAGILADALAPDQPVPMVATRDVADVAARALRAPDWTGIAVREVLGPKELTSAEVARILARALDMPQLAYVQLPYPEMVQALIEAGFAPDIAELTVGMARGMNEGRIRSTHVQAASSATPTRFEQFAEELAEAFRRL